MTLSPEDKSAVAIHRDDKDNLARITCWTAEGTIDIVKLIKQSANDQRIQVHTLAPNSENLSTCWIKGATIDDKGRLIDAQPESLPQDLLMASTNQISEAYRQAGLSPLFIVEGVARQAFSDMAMGDYNVYGTAEKIEHSATDSDELRVETSGNDYAILKKGSIPDKTRKARQAQQSEATVLTGNRLNNFLGQDKKALEQAAPG